MAMTIWSGSMVFVCLGFLVVIIICTFRVAARLSQRAANRSRHVIVLVLGDVGRSPRMQYHCLSLADLPAEVTLVGYPGEACFPALQQHPRIKQRLIMAPTFITKGLPRALSMPIKVVLQIVQLMWTLLWGVPQPDVLLLQNPPCIPTLIVALFVSLLRNCRVIVDWHNLGYTVLALRFGSDERHPVVRIAKVYERVLGKCCHGGLCVTKAMQGRLRENWGITASVLYDRPPHHFRRQTEEESSELFSRLSREYPVFRDMHRVPLIVSSTSWSEDEDFGMLLAAIETLETQSGPRLLFVITGKGPQKSYYEQRIASMQMTRCTVITAWLAPEDYPRLLGSATLGVSLHTSTSGCDLPMKVVDMFGAGLPVCAVGFECLDELVKHGRNGMVFTSSAELAEQISNLLQNYPDEERTLQTLREGVREFQQLRWQDNWLANAKPLFE